MSARLHRGAMARRPRNWKSGFGASRLRYRYGFSGDANTKFKNQGCADSESRASCIKRIDIRLFCLTFLSLFNDLLAGACQ